MLLGTFVDHGGALLKFVFLNSIDDYWLEKLEYLKQRFSKDSFITGRDHPDSCELIEEADALISGRLPDEDLRRAKKLKAIFVPWTGVNNLPLNSLKERGIVVSNNHGNAAIVAERAIALALAVTGRVVFLHNEMGRGIWPGRTDDRDTSWFSIQGKTCAILGLGQIGIRIAKILKAFDCKVMGYRRDLSKGKPDHVDVLADSFQDAIKASAIVFLAMPLTDDTRGLIDVDALKNMKDKFLVNISRGEIIDEKALFDALKDGTLAGAAIDTWYHYPSRKHPVVFPSKYPVHTLPNIVMSPHVASWTPEGIRLMIDETVKSIESYILKGRPLYEVDLDLTY